jgi:hypothetical protein
VYKDKQAMHPAVSLRDYLAAQAMQANIASWNAEISSEYRIKLLKDWVKHYGNKTVYECVALISYEMADAMLSVRNGKGCWTDEDMTNGMMSILEQTKKSDNSVHEVYPDIDWAKEYVNSLKETNKP